MQSILQEKKECYITHQKEPLYKYDIFDGQAQQINEMCGFWVWLLPRYYNESDDGVFSNPKLRLSIRKACQREYEQEHGRSEFIKLVGKSYL